MPRGLYGHTHGRDSLGPPLNAGRYQLNITFPKIRIDAFWSAIKDPLYKSEWEQIWRSADIDTIDDMMHVEFTMVDTKSANIVFRRLKDYGFQPRKTNLTTGEVET